MVTPENNLYNRGHLRRKGALLGIIASLFATSCDTSVEGHPASPTQGGDYLATHFNALLEPAVAAGMCVVTSDPRITESPNRMALFSPLIYNPADGPPDLNSVAQRDLSAPTRFRLHFRVEGSHVPPPGQEADRTTLIIDAHMKSDSPFAEGSELSKDMLDPEDVDLKKEAAITIAGADGKGERLMRDKEVSSRNYPNEASNIQHPVDDSHLDAFQSNFNPTLDHLLDVSQTDCQQP